MANIKVRLKRRDGTSFDDLFPEVKTGTILKSSGAALSTFSSELLEASENGTSTTFVTGDSDGGFNLRTASQVRDALDIAASSHTHQISEVTGLQAALDDKASLTNGKITQLPDGIDVEAMKFVGVTGDLGASGSAVTLSSKFSLNSLSTTQLNQKLGDYLIATNSATNRFIKENTSNGNSYEFLLAPNDADDDQTSSTTNVEIEAGDRIVFVKYTETSTDVFTFFFAVINSSHSVAETDKFGVVELSSGGSALSAYSTSTSDRHTRVVDENSLRDAMRDQRTIVEFTGNSSGTIKYWATAVSNLPSSGVSEGDRALVGTGTSKDIYVYDTNFGSGWTNTNADATFPTDYTAFPANSFDESDIVYYDAGQTEYLYISSNVNSSLRVLSVAANTVNSTILPVDGDLVYYISP